MNINSSSYYSVGGSTGSGSSGISGLMSGMDTESMVEKMLSGTQAKIDKQEALKQQTLWKQDIYRDVITSINSFRNKYFNTMFGASSKNNFASSAFFNAMKSVVKSGDALKVTGSTSSATTGDIRVKVQQLASASKLESGVNLSSNQITGTTLTDAAMNDRFNRQLTLKMDGATLTVDLNSVTTQTELADKLNEAFKTASGFSGVTASVDKGVLHLQTSDPAKKIEVDSAATTSAALALTGLTQNSNTEIKDADGKLLGYQLGGHGSVNMNTGLSVDLTLDGVSKTIRLNNVAADYSDPTSPNFGKVTVDSVYNALKSEVKKAFGDYIEVKNDGGKFSFGVNIKDATGNIEKGHELIITGADAKTLGITPGASTRINYTTKLKDLGVGGDRYEFSINGVNFKFDGDTTVSKMMNTINASSAGVRMSYSSLSDTFKLESTNTGAKYGIDIQQAEGNVMGRLFGNDKVAGSAKVSTGGLTTDNIQGDPNGLVGYKTEEATLTMNVNGTNYTFSLPKKKNDDGTDHVYEKDEIETEFNKWLGDNFSQKVGNANVPQITYNGGKLEIKEGYTVKFTANALAGSSDAAAVEAAKKTDLAFAMGFNTADKSNLANKDTDISTIHGMKENQDLFLNGTNQAGKLGEITGLKGYGAVSVKFTDDNRLELTRPGGGPVDLGATPALAKLFGTTQLNFGNGAIQAGAVEAGTDAIVTVNGIETTRSGNSFTIDGITMELTKVSKTNADGSIEETVISSSRDTESVVEGFKAFVEDYNAMIEKLNGYVGEDANYRDYAPLTAAQKKEMSESEIKLWEEKAKQGLVRRDSTINTFLSEMRLAMYTKPAGSSLALYNIGIETGDYKDKGKLNLDEAKLRSALSTDPEAVNTLFTSATDGLSATMMKAMKSAAETSTGSAGSLVKLAGIKGGATEKNNTLYKNILDINNRISDLKYKYEREKTRYWNQFNTMESVLANYNSQSMWMTQQFSGQ